MNALKSIRKQIERNINGPMKEESCRIRANNEIQNALQGIDIVKFIK
jgi:hypothetical protein